MSAPVLSLLFLFALVQQGYLFKSPNAFDGHDDDFNLKIVKGKLASHSQFPYQVYIFTRWERNNQGGYSGFFCGGVILNPTTIVTASHCFFTKGKRATADQIIVKVGVDYKQDEDPDKVFQASELHTHPDYNPQTFHNDIAIVKLQTPITYSYNVDRACLNFMDRQYDYLIASGYGGTTQKRTDQNGDVVGDYDSGNQLKYAYFYENRNQRDDCSVDFVCIEATNMDASVPDSVCNGDSGGPLSTPPDEDGEMEVIGLSSNSPIYRQDDGTTLDCTGKSKYTRLSKHIDWIDQIVGKNDYCWTRPRTR